MRFILLVAVVLAGTVAWADIAPTPRAFPFHRIGLEVLTAAGGGALLHALRRRRKDDDELEEECRSRVASVMPELKLRLKERYEKTCADRAELVNRYRNDLERSCKEMIVTLLEEDHALYLRCVGIPIEVLASKLVDAFDEE